MQNWLIHASFIFFLILFVIIGLLSKLKSKPTSIDYLLANHEVKPWLVSLSAVATNNSGYMFIGMIGYTYSVGIASMWLAIGWVFGDLLASLIIHRSLREHTESSQAYSFPSLLAQWYPPTFKWLKRIAALIVIIFLGTYAAAQLNAGSKALHALFQWHYATGAILGAVIVLVYCYAGGIRASIWTDVAQSFVMIVAMATMCYLSFREIGDLDSVVQQLTIASPTYFNMFSDDLMFGPLFGPILFVIGWMFAGFGVAGQPHIMVRFMSLDQPNHMKRVRVYYYSWYTLFFALTILAGIAARLLIQETNFDVELALPILAIKLFPAPVVGLVLAGLFAATMSTADSQILSCAASLTKDIVKIKDSYWINKVATTLVTLLALTIALSGNKNVFALVVFSWAVLASAFTPLLLIYALKQSVNELTACLMVLTGMITALVWSQFPISNTLYSVCPGILSGLLVFVASKFTIRIMFKYPPPL